MYPAWLPLLVSSPHYRLRLWGALCPHDRIKGIIQLTYGIHGQCSCSCSNLFLESPVVEGGLGVVDHERDKDGCEPAALKGRQLGGVLTHHEGEGEDKRAEGQRHRPHEPHERRATLADRRLHVALGSAAELHWP